MIPKYEDLDRINNISAELAARFAVLYDKIVALEIENERLRDERDKARRMLCQFESRLDFEYGNIDPSRFGPVAIAAERGWDCFKEDSK